MHVSSITKAASLLGAVALTGGGLLFSGTAWASDTTRADDGRTFDCQMIRLFADDSLEGYVCGAPTTYDGPGRVRYLHGTGGWTCKNISARPSPAGGANGTTVLGATGCTPV
ncbi:hypothetical protein AB0D14_31205 [Streptomyces sp. NPDC048484]|uniref:hypothetical protein n=1 Tax=Streptomyces sp. NPDC048484 TaxID=3155146 RepID=UPI0034134F8C